MLRWYLTGFIAAFAGALTYLTRGSPYRPGADTALEVSYIAGAALAPLVAGAVLAALAGLVVASSPGGFHRRTNLFALLVLAALVALQFSKRVV